MTKPDTLIELRAAIGSLSDLRVQALQDGLYDLCHTLDDQIRTLVEHYEEIDRGEEKSVEA